ncbi:MAG TPA: hypothetical protein VKT80_10975, partial [Chloroflexota bacterium]|nr:hypothetical protein [Chloroflexota bacterium]
TPIGPGRRPTVAVISHLRAMAPGREYALLPHRSEGDPLCSRDTGGRGDAQLARLGHTAGMNRQCGSLAPVMIDIRTVIAAVENAREPGGVFLDRRAAMRPPLRDLADEARELMTQYW